MGRKRTNINYSQLDKLLGLQCTLKECAFYFNCSEDTIERAVRRDKNTSFAEYRELKRQAGLISLRRSQFQLSEKNPSMAIWLGKQYLNQNETPSDIKINANITSEKLADVFKQIGGEGLAE